MDSSHVKRRIFSFFIVVLIGGTALVVGHKLARNELISKILPSAMEVSNGIMSNNERRVKEESKHNKVTTILIIYDLALATTLRILNYAQKKTIFVDGPKEQMLCSTGISFVRISFYTRAVMPWVDPDDKRGWLFVFVINDAMASEFVVIALIHFCEWVLR